MDPIEPDNIRLKPEMGGGSLLDVGCYPVYGIRWAFGEEPVRVMAQGRNAPWRGPGNGRGSRICRWPHGAPLIAGSPTLCACNWKSLGKRESSGPAHVAPRTRGQF